MADLVSVAMMAAAGLVFVLLQLVPAWYGRYADKAPRWLGCLGWLVPGPRACWVVQEVPNVIMWALMFLWLPRTRDTPARSGVNLLLSGYFLLHYLHRSFVFPFRLSSPKPSTLICFVLAVLFCSINGFLQCRALAWGPQYSADWLRDPRFWLGTAAFFLGMGVNIHSDSILMNLRKPGETGYKVPRGGAFDWPCGGVSGANFAGEILEWTGFAVACWSPEALAFAVFTACNIGPRALQHHKWYLAKFGDEYPTRRHALVPGVL